MFYRFQLSHPSYIFTVQIEQIWGKYATLPYFFVDLKPFCIAIHRSARDSIGNIRIFYVKFLYFLFHLTAFDFVYILRWKSYLELRNFHLEENKLCVPVISSIISSEIQFPNRSDSSANCI